MKFPRIIHLDVSDSRVFDPAAEPGEPAVPGSFAFAETDPGTLSGKDLRAFTSGWLGVGSFGRATFVQVGELDDAGFDDAVERLAGHFVTHYGAPDLETARPVAREEIEDAAKLCEGAPGTLLAIEREMTADGLAERVYVVPHDQTEGPAPAWRTDDEGDGTA